MPSMWLNGVQRDVAEVITDLWPGESIEESALALCEEAGEVARAIIKRNFQRRKEGDRTETEDEWTTNLRLELSQVVIVALKIAEREGFSMGDALEEELFALQERYRRKTEG